MIETNLSEETINIYRKPWGIFKKGVCVHAWKIHPDAWDLMDLKYDELRLLTPTEINKYT